jgi:hypothetical protein
MMRFSISGLLLLAIAWVAASAQADLLRCKGPDGRTIYTDKKALCPGAEPFEPSAELQQAPGAESPDGAAAPAPFDERRDRAAARKRAAEAEEGEARRWRLKKEKGEDALEALTRRRAELDDFVTWCNRGGSVVTRDDAGIKRSVSCATIRKQYAEIDGEEAKLRGYLTRGLSEECRKAGCLPGWIR